MVLVGRENRVHATSQISNDAWFDKLALDKSIAQALKDSHNLCFVVYGQKGSGKDYCLTGGYLLTNKAGELPMTKEPGIVRLAYEAIVAQICINTNAQFTI